ncbi:MAG TPA: SGNH/GDSL hydrolase family protein [Bacteroidia bacterium]|nr:SGNH/GDSL hydrolase family protein [Bacteroidia bacterium]HNT79392.1 SGNH/GDSL hydrolase family protein [Bacteroidia bacterium]
MSTKTILCLGDSYTIGELVVLEDNFPNQLHQLLLQKGLVFDVPKIIATTGWTTDELQKAIDEEKIHQCYDIVTLLIGVNNQYRGRSLENYRSEFENLLKQAIQFSKQKNVVVLSIPDWGCTPFAEGKDRNKIALEIDAFNKSKKEICDRYKVPFLDITHYTRNNLEDLLSSDGLHYSAKMYELWTADLFQLLQQNKLI